MGTIEMEVEVEGVRVSRQEGRKEGRKSGLDWGVR